MYVTKIEIFSCDFYLHAINVVFAHLLIQIISTPEVVNATEYLNKEFEVKDLVYLCLELQLEHRENDISVNQSM